MIGYQVETNMIHIPEYFTSGEYVSPAYTAGITTGERIVAINGKKISGFTDIQSAVIFPTVRR